MKSENGTPQKHKLNIKTRCGGSGIFGILTLLKVPKMSIMPLCIIKNGALIFREKGFLNEVSADFLEMSVNVSAGSP